MALDFVGAEPVAPAGRNPAETTISYWGPGRSALGTSAFSEVVYPDLWPGIDLAYSGNGRRLKYEFRVHPGADPGDIRLDYDGATLSSEGGALRVESPAGSLTDEPPSVWQVVQGRHHPVASGYSLHGGGSYGFRLGNYDPSRPLVIDPALVFSGFIGGSDTDIAGNCEFSGNGIAVDDSGTYVAGATFSADFPAVVGPDTSYNGGIVDAFVAKVKPDGTGLVYAGFLGGSTTDCGLGVAVDPSGSAYLTGFTSSGDFPAIIGPDSTKGGEFDGFVAKVTPDGAGLVYSGFLGGSEDFDVGLGIDVDDAGNAYVTGEVTSSDFPATVGPDTSYNGNEDAFVAKVNPSGSGFTYAGFLGGTMDDIGTGISVDGAGNAYVVGLTEGDFPASVGPDTSFNGGSTDAFISKVKADGTGLVYAGFLGGSFSDLGLGVAVDGAGSAHISGTTASSDFPALVGPDTSFNGGSSDAFVAQVTPDGTGLVHSGFLGGSGVETAPGPTIAVDTAGSAYLVGSTDSPDFPALVGPDTSYNGGPSDVFITKVGSGGAGLDYSGFVGGSGQDDAGGIAVDLGGNAFLTGRTASMDFPAMVGPDTSFNGGSHDAFVAKVQTTERCKGRPVTRLGSDGKDTITGTPGKDVVLALGERDSINTAGGNDLVCAGTANDRATGGAGNDRIFGEAGNDKLKGGGGNDRLKGQQGRDNLSGGGGAKDRCTGGPGADVGTSCERGRV